MSVAEIAGAWLAPSDIQPLGAGHIHDTYLVRGDVPGPLPDDNEPDDNENAPGAYVLQRINQAVFKDAPLLMEQTERVLAHWSTQSRYRVPELCLTRNGASHVGREGVWRLWRFLENTRVIDPVENAAQAEAAGLAFGAFQTHMRNLPGARLEDTIDGFLQLDYYLSAFDQVAAKAPEAERRLVDKHRSLGAALAQRNAYIHGDCKINNLLFEESVDQVAAVIDFDTVMYGHWAWDLGDLVRSVCFSRGKVRVEDFASCMRGFAASQPQTAVEPAIQAPGYVALMLGVRFLTDHLTGDRYFRVSRSGENLHRAQEQFALFSEFQRNETELREAAAAVLQG